MTDLHTAPTVDLGDPSAPADPTVPGGLPDPADRGLLDIAPAVAEKIARRVAGEVEGAVGPVRADADMGPGRATLRLELGVEYPRPVGEVAAEVQRRVASRIGELTGLSVEAVTVTVTQLPAPAPRRGRRVV
ncbi:MAG TPA: Asp23/Gls24 family envelope stress response protein [Acidimicrobiales bacterium]|nr:Asp23/Gls24 family envelope stress response protein [Acidimicrobiales bacterium]